MILRLLFNALILILFLFAILFIKLEKSDITLPAMYALVVIIMTGLVYEKPYDFNRWFALSMVTLPVLWGLQHDLFTAYRRRTDRTANHDSRSPRNPALQNQRTRPPE